MILNVRRTFKGQTYTIGQLTVNGKPFCQTLEDTDRGLKKTMLLSEIQRRKVKDETAIPTGTYSVIIRIKSPKFSGYRYRNQYGFCDGYLPRLLGVPGYDGVLIHAGSDSSHTSGCILVGRNTIVGKLTQSTDTFRMLYGLIKEADERGETISITIE